MMVALLRGPLAASLAKMGGILTSQLRIDAERAERENPPTPLSKFLEPALKVPRRSGAEGSSRDFSIRRA